MKKLLLCLLVLLMVYSKSVATEYDADFYVSFSDCELSFVIISSQNHTVSLSGDGEYDDGVRDYWPAVEVKTADFPYNLIIPQTVVDENVSYDVVAIADGAFGNGTRTSTDKVYVKYWPMDYASSIYSLTLPSTIQTINSMLPNIKILKCCATTPPALNKSIPSSCSIIYVPQSSLANYQSATGWSSYADRMVGYSSGSNLITDISFSSKSFETNTATPLQLIPTVTPNSSASNITWSSSDTSIATVDASGLVTGVSPGECYITATSSDGGFVFATIKITINPTPPITNITLNETEKTIFTGDLLNTVTLNPTISPSESAGVGVTWSSSNSSVASVDQNGVVTAVATGAATITCIANDESGITASCQITVDELSSTRIGTGTNSTNNAPFHSSTSINEVFMRYKYNEIGIAGNLHAISFDENWTNGYVRNIGVEIWMGRKDDDTFYSSTGAQSVNLMLNGMTRVYQGVITIEPNNNGSKRLRTIVLDTPFYYDGSYDLNIFVATTFNSTSTSLKYDYTTTPYTSSNPNTVKYRTLDDNLYSQWTTSRQRPNIQMWFNDIILVKDINSSDISISSISAVTYNGSAQTPAVTVKDGTTTLVNGTDYTVAYSNNTNAGTATVTITGMGNYTGTKNANFTINPKNASSLTINSIAAVTYNGLARTPAVTVKDGTTTLTSGTHYTVAYSNNTNAGMATVTITGMGNYTGTKNANFTINPKNASNLTISSIAAQTYSGSAKTPTVTVMDGSTTLTSGTHYTVAYSNNTNAGTATVTITGMGNYTGTKNANFTINPKNASNLTINSIAAQTYSGSAQTPTVTVKDGSTTLTSGTHYTVAYSNNTNAGTATVTITGMGNYTGTKNANFTINAKGASNLTINPIDAVTYNGSAKTPTVTVKDGTTTLTSGTHYTVSYSNNTNAGTATVTITGMGNYTSTKNANFTINKAPLTITAKSYTITEGDPLPSFECTYSGFQNGETESVLTTLPTITCDATDSETAGEYDITPSGAAATNYSFNYVSGTLTVNAAESVTIAMKTGGGVARSMIAYSSKYALDFTSRPELKAYIACGYNDKKEVLLVHVKVVPPYTGMVIKTSNGIYDGGEYDVPTTTEEYYYANLLVPVVETGTVTPTETIADVEYTNLTIGTLVGGGIGFVRLTSNWTTHNKSYLRIPTALYNSLASARGFGDIGVEFVEGEEATGILNAKRNALENNGNYYDLLGRKVKPIGKGLYIHNGKKVLVK